MTAEQEVRSAGISCPSCGLNLAGLMRISHRLALTYTGNGFGHVECRDGQPVDLSDLATARAAYNMVTAEGWLYDLYVPDLTPLLRGCSPLSTDIKSR